MGNTPVLELRKVCFDYRHNEVPVHALRHVNMAVLEDSFVAVVGPSGSGKSTLLALMGLLHAPSAGEVWVDGQSTLGLNDEAMSALRQHKMGFVFQHYHLLPNQDALGNVETALFLRGMRRGARRERAVECLARVGLADRKSHRPSQLSGGEQQRVALARAIAPEPRVLLADEPTGNLDSGNRDQLLDLFDELHADGMTLVIVTHEPLVAARARSVVKVIDGVVKGPV